MKHHLTDNQFARCVVGKATAEELRHSQECPDCASELNRFGESVALFQSAIRKQTDNSIGSLQVRVSQPPEHSISSRRWVLVAAAAVILVVLPFIGGGKNVKEAQMLTEPVSISADPNAVMSLVNRHLSRTVPGPMEPLLLGIPGLNP